MNSSEKPHEEIQFSLVPQLFIPLLKDYAPNLFEKSLPLLFFFFLILLLTKVLNAAPKHPVRDMLYHTSQELVWFSHEKQSGIPDCLKNPILDRYGTVLYWYILSGSGSVEARFRSNNVAMEKEESFFNFMDPVWYRTIPVGDQYGAQYQFSIPCSLLFFLNLRNDSHFLWYFFK